MALLRHIAVEGPPGSGKTAIAAALSDRLGGKLILDPEDNPFLGDFRTDISTTAFQTQIWYLLSRFRLEDEFAQPDLFRDTVVSDYFFDRDEIYASLTLGQDELLLYRSLYNLLKARRNLPDLVIHLQLSVEEALRRAPNLEPAFVKLITDAYNGYFFAYAKTPLLIVRADDFNPIARENEMEELIEAMAAMNNNREGRRYFSPTVNV